MRKLLVCIILSILFLSGVSVSATRYLSTLQLVAHGYPYRSGPPMYFTVQLDAGPSVWRSFVKVQSATFVGTYYESIKAWLSDPPDPSVDVIRSPEPIDGPYQLGKKPAQLPLKDAVPPLDVVLEIHPTKRSYDGSPPAITVTVYYRYLFLRRHLTWRSPDLR